MGTNNWLLQYNSNNKLLKDSYKRFLEQLSLLEIHKVSKKIKSGVVPASSDNDILFLEARKLIELFKDTNVITFADDSELMLDDVEYQFKILGLSLEEFIN